jgi:amino acid adenylation domain-containing protein/FkbM family methyltransferase
MYRTGDLVRWNGRGELEYLSRVDDQVQVNGLRIELREIEIALRAHPAVRAAAVAAQPLGRDGTRLVANVVPDPEVVPVVAALATASGLHETLYRRTMAPGVRVCGPNPTELEFLGREIFHDRDYLAGGISLPPDATVVDVGAHIGMFAVFVGAARPRARVVAVEPVPELCALLRYNTLANGCRVAVHQVGLAAEPGRAEFTYYPGLSLLSGRYADAAADRAMVEAVAGRAGGADGGESAELGRLIDERMASRTVTVEMSTLSEVIDAEGLERIDLVKIDVERSEYDGLAGLREEHWHRIAQFAIEVHDEEGGNLARVVAMLERHGFRTRVRVGRSQEGTGLVMVTASHPERVREDGSGAPGTPDAAGRSGDAGRPDDGGADEAEPLVAQLRSHLAERLPTYMIPGQMSVVAALPVTANGKLDRNALVLPRNREPGAAVALDPFQVAVADLMSGVLAGGPLGPGDDFFAAGGHSLLAIRVANEVRATFGVDLAVRDIFDNPTPARLADVIRRAANAARPPLVPVDRCGDLPLSFGQQRTWLLDRMSGEGHVYHIPLALRLRGPLDVSALEAAVNDLVARHEILRTCYPDQNGTPVQRVVPVEQARLTMYRVAADEDAVDALLSGFATEPIDLGVDLPVRTQLLVLGEHAHILALCFHHIAFDGWSLDPLWNDLSGLYRARVRGGRPDLPDLPVQYADFAAWQLRLLGSEEDPESLAARQMAYWRRALANAPEALSLPLDRPRPYEPTFQAGSYRFDIDPATQRQLRQVARDAGGSLFMVLHAALATFLTRAGAGTDIAIGTPTAGRADRAFEAMIGFFANTLTLRVDSSGDPTFRDVVSRARRAALDALANSDLPFERVVELANPHRSVSLHPLFQIMMTLTPYPPRTPSFEDLDCEPVPISNGSTKFDLQLAFHENEASQQMDCLIEYSRDIFEPATIERLAKRLAAVLTGASANPDLPISRLELVDDAEWARLARLGEGDALPVTDTSPGQRLRELAAADPAAPMLVGTGGEQLSRAELVDRAAGWAGVLRAAGVVEGRAVGLAMARSVDRVVATVALAWCGAVAVPVDPAWPAERRDLIAADVDMRLVVTDGQAVTASLPEIVVSGAPPGDAVRIRPVPGGQRPLYIMYTSGSTGRPKGVQVTHQNVMNLVRNAFLSTPARRQLSLASHAFDASTLEVWGTLLNGGALVVPPPGQLGPEEIRTYLHEHAVSHLFLTTALLSLMADEAPDLFAGLVEIATGGEALPAGTVRAVLTAAPATVLRNCYGPTEVTVMATHHEVGQRDLEQERVAIGHPVDGAVVYVLDEHLRPVPEGVTGHLWVGGHGVSSGYVNNPAATAERFLPDLFRGDGSRMYRTGDLASWRTDGKLEFRGREDDQIKLRGHRIEPGEVSAVLEMHPAVRHAFTALRREGERGGLFSWVVLAEGGQERDVPPLLSAHLSRHLPGYMLPGAVTVVERLPVTATGKIDKAALPAPAVVSSGRQPTTVEEQAVCRAFAEVVGTDRIGLDSDFFAVGGDSLLAVRLASRLQQVLGTHPGVRAIFHHPTPAGLLAAVRGEDQEEAWAREDDAWRPLLRLRPGGHLPPLFCVHPAIGLAWCYRSLLPHLDDGIPVVGLQSPGVTGAAPSRLEEAAARFVDIVEGHQPAGPVCLLGWSVGGVIAHEVAVQLQRRGRQVSLLALVDAYPDLGAGSREPQVRLSERALSRALSLTAGARSVMDSKRHERVLSAVQANVGMCHGFRPGRFEGDLLFFIAKLGRTDRSPDPMSWRELVTGDVTYCDLPATHDDALRPVPARIIGRSLSESSVYTREPVVDRAAPAPTCRGHGSDGGRVEGPEPSTGSSGN